MSNPDNISDGDENPPADEKVIDDVSPVGKLLGNMIAEFERERSALKATPLIKPRSTNTEKEQ
ncbi:hypothetical protein HN512_01905 [Candidatus Peregrinibacteria bacterium]|jgi:hypothetical protein|nr:hypothetical protein [Candidatus Peregrinibacteria bacterium]MBT3598568.1 hypothetical protein [Candidatus Peregrinibacteria bacterium]MBT4367403.1 hypothetical protein [Candidatus Peregrinibacteria bacterium]MBT4585283.1 hypothetical protein [Candidatus Peregrinibacteria bacterium]MBT6730563.1 hypothetical protein [Candidatus Peregrinibacteria bacterium]